MVVPMAFQVEYEMPEAKKTTILFNLYRHRPTHFFTTPQAC